MVDFFVQGGGFMWPILIALLFGLAIIGERAYSLKYRMAQRERQKDERINIL